MPARRSRATSTDPGPLTAFGTTLRSVLGAAGPAVRTRFAPAPTGLLHLGHVANALVVWQVARATRGRVVLRIEDHDRQRCRPAYELALLDDLVTLGFEPDEPPIARFRSGAPTPYRQSDNGSAYAAAVTSLADAGRLYACDCSRATFAAWMADRGAAWSGPGCPGGCRRRAVPLDAPGVAWRADIGDGDEPWEDLVLGPRMGPVAPTGDPPVRDRHGNWTYGLCVVVDDRDQAIDLVVRGRDLLDATAGQVRLARILGRTVAPRFLHHPLILRPDGRKLSKADHATGIRELLERGATPAELRHRASEAIGLD